MPKMKTKSAAKKRFKLTASKKAKYKPAGLRHLLSHESSGSKRKKRALRVVDLSDDHRLIRYFPYGF